MAEYFFHYLNRTVGITARLQKKFPICTKSVRANYLGFISKTQEIREPDKYKAELLKTRNIENNEKQYRTVFRFFATTLVASAQAEVRASPQTVDALKSILFKPLLEKDCLIYDAYGGDESSFANLYELMADAAPHLRQLSSDPIACKLVETLKKDSEKLKDDMHPYLQANVNTPSWISIHHAKHAVLHLDNALAAISSLM